MRIVPRFLAKSFIFARLMMTATMSASIDWNRSVSQCSHLGSHSGSDSVADVSPSASFPGVNISSMCHWHVKEIMTTFAHHFSVILAHFREVFPWIVYTIPVSLHVEHHSSSNVRVDSDSRRLCVPAKTHPWSRGCSYWVRMTLQGWVEWGGMLLVFVFIHAGRKTALTVVAVAHSQLINAWCYANRIRVLCPCFNFLAIDWFLFRSIAQEAPQARIKLKLQWKFLVWRCQEGCVSFCT